MPEAPSNEMFETEDFKRFYDASVKEFGKDKVTIEKAKENYAKYQARLTPEAMDAAAKEYGEIKSYEPPSKTVSAIRQVSEVPYTMAGTAADMSGSLMGAVTGNDYSDVPGGSRSLQRGVNELTGLPTPLTEGGYEPTLVGGALAGAAEAYLPLGPLSKAISTGSKVGKTLFTSAQRGNKRFIVGQAVRKMAEESLSHQKLETLSGLAGGLARSMAYSPEEQNHVMTMLAEMAGSSTPTFTTAGIKGTLGLIKDKFDLPPATRKGWELALGKFYKRLFEAEAEAADTTPRAYFEEVQRKYGGEVTPSIFVLLPNLGDYLRKVADDPEIWKAGIGNDRENAEYLLAQINAIMQDAGVERFPAERAADVVQVLREKRLGEVAEATDKAVTRFETRLAVEGHGGDKADYDKELTRLYNTATDQAELQAETAYSGIDQNIHMSVRPLQDLMAAIESGTVVQGLEHGVPRARLEDVPTKSMRRLYKLLKHYADRRPGVRRGLSEEEVFALGPDGVAKEIRRQLAELEDVEIPMWEIEALRSGIAADRRALPRSDSQGRRYLSIFQDYIDGNGTMELDPNKRIVGVYEQWELEQPPNDHTMKQLRKARQEYRNFMEVANNDVTKKLFDARAGRVSVPGGDTMKTFLRNRKSVAAFKRMFRHNDDAQKAVVGHLATEMIEKRTSLQIDNWVRDLKDKGIFGSDGLTKVEATIRNLIDLRAKAEEMGNLNTDLNIAYREGVVGAMTGRNPLDVRKHLIGGGEYNSSSRLTAIDDLIGFSGNDPQVIGFIQDSFQEAVIGKFHREIGLLRRKMHSPNSTPDVKKAAYDRANHIISLIDANVIKTNLELFKPELKLAWGDDYQQYMAAMDQTMELSTMLKRGRFVSFNTAGISEKEKLDFFGKAVLGTLGRIYGYTRGVPGAYVAADRAIFAASTKLRTLGKEAIKDIFFKSIFDPNIALTLAENATLQMPKITRVLALNNIFLGQSGVKEQQDDEGMAP